LLDPVNPLAMAGAPAFLHGIAVAVNALLDDLPRGAGVSYAEYGRPLRYAISALNRPGFVHSMGDWMTALPDIHERLVHGGVIVDAGCGTGWSTIALATLYPRASVIGLDLDSASLAEARVNAVQAGVADRVEFELVDVGDRRAVAAAVGARAQLVTIFEALHDMNGPERALSALGRILDDGGAILVADEKVADAFAPGGDFLERLNYAFSILHCLPATIAEGGGEANGTVLRAATVARWAEAAGLQEPVVLDVDNPVWRFYRLGVR
jgi:SAM-dependent methyltransferase